MSDVDIDRVRWLVKVLRNFEDIETLASEHGLADDIINTALNPELSRISMEARELRKELEDNALDIARTLVEVIDGE